MLQSELVRAYFALPAETRHSPESIKRIMAATDASAFRDELKRLAGGVRSEYELLAESGASPERKQQLEALLSGVEQTAEASHFSYYDLVSLTVDRMIAHSRMDPRWSEGERARYLQQFQMGLPFFPVLPFSKNGGENGGEVPFEIQSRGLALGIYYVGMEFFDKVPSPNWKYDEHDLGHFKASLEHVASTRDPREIPAKLDERFPSADKFLEHRNQRLRLWHEWGERMNGQPNPAARRELLGAYWFPAHERGYEPTVEGFLEGFRRDPLLPTDSKLFAGDRFEDFREFIEQAAAQG